MISIKSFHQRPIILVIKGSPIFKIWRIWGKINLPDVAIKNIAAICNGAGNVMAMMPHPERTKNGDAIFTSMREYIENGNPLINQKMPHQYMILTE